MATTYSEMIMKPQTYSDAVVFGCQPLLQDGRFNVVERAESQVRLESELVTITFDYLPARGYELVIGFTFRRADIPDIIPFNLGEVLREYNAGEPHSLTLIQTRSLDEIGLAVRQVCEVLVSKCAAVLNGELTAFESLRARRTIESANYTMRVRLSSIQQQADEAWHAKDYARYSNLLSGLESVLSESERRKLDYAKVTAKKNS